MVAIDSLIPFDKNPRRISETGLEKVRRSIKHFGFLNPVIVQKSTGVIIAGHQRTRAAKEEGLLEVPVLYVDLDDADAVAYNIADNRLTEEAKWDEMLLAELLEEGDAAHARLTGLDEMEINKLLALLQPVDPALDEAPDPPVTPTAKLGDVWACGAHRLACGSATDPAAVAALVGDDSVDCIFTDPPYGVAIASRVGRGSMSSAEARSQGGATIQNDDLGDQGTLELVRDAMLAALPHLKEGGPFYICTASTQQALFESALEEAGLEIRSIIVWVKDSMVLGRGDYQWKHEPILYGWKPGAKHTFYGGRSQTTVWEHPRPKRSKEHPTMKPIGIIEQALGNSTMAGDVVLDLFSGSGSTIIAAERTGRKALAIEIDPRFVDVGVARWEKLTGEKAVLLDPSP